VSASPEMKGISADLISDLMAKGRSKNVYGPKFAEWFESDEAAINPAEVWPLEFGRKEASTIYQGFLGAAKKANLQDAVMIKQSDGAVFLLHKERVNLLLTASNGDEASA
jgi:hypothetical protein